MALKSSLLSFRRNWRKTSSRFFTSRGPCTIRADFCRDTKARMSPGGAAAALLWTLCDRKAPRPADPGRPQRTPGHPDRCPCSLPFSPAGRLSGHGRTRAESNCPLSTFLSGCLS